MTLADPERRAAAATGPRPAARRMLGELRELEREALAEMRALIFELRPGSLERGRAGAGAADAYARRSRDGSGCRSPSTADSVERLPIEIEDALYRIAQEALHNVVKHAAASNVAVRARREGGVARAGGGGRRCGVRSGGTGCRAALGIAGMRARAEKLGGRLLVRSRPGQGSRVEVVRAARARRTDGGAGPRMSTSAALRVRQVADSRRRPARTPRRMAADARLVGASVRVLLVDADRRVRECLRDLISLR